MPTAPGAVRARRPCFFIFSIETCCRSVWALQICRESAPGGAGPSFDVERLLLITEALWNIIREKHGAEETELIKQITALDMEDGKLDGRKPRTPPQPCPKCGRTLIKNRPRCFYCAEPIAADPFER